jgi:hypothetical protein
MFFRLASMEEVLALPASVLIRMQKAQVAAVYYPKANSVCDKNLSVAIP